MAWFFWLRMDQVTWTEPRWCSVGASVSPVVVGGYAPTVCGGDSSVLTRKHSHIKRHLDDADFLARLRWF